MPSIDPNEPLELTVAPSESGWRLDAFLAHYLTDYSRVHLRRVIVAGEVKVDGRGGKPSYRLKPGQRVTLTLPEIPREGPTPEDIPLDILYDDDELAVVNKPAGMVVHPARGHWSGTLASALQFRFGSQLSHSGGPTRPGIVHRLDRDTSGVIVVAKNDQAHAKLATQFELRTTEKEYFAITSGIPNRDRDVIEEPIGPHPKIRERMAIRRNHPDAREAITFYEVLESFAPKNFATVRVQLKTGRTHQIRIHLDHIGTPVLCDRLYGGCSQITVGRLCPDRADDETVLLDRQALHARQITFDHPTTGQRMTVEAPIPPDMQAVLDALR
ncbi:MAG: RluA family pseudouridine synthase [Planctomycetia bacterium]|jgi:23S rRNA pseudouridine1911/1915/1917 synthase